MRSFNATREVPEDMTAADYLLDCLEASWNVDTEYCGSRADMSRAWTLQNEVRAVHGLEPIPEAELERACAGFGAMS